MEVVLKFITPDAEAHIGEAAAQCYDAKTDRAANLRRAIKCKDSGHLAVLRFAYADFEISGISRICSHQLVRVAHAGILQASQRYIKQSQVEFIQPPSLADLSDDLRLRWAKLEQDSRNLCADAAEAGMKKEDARFCLLHSAATSLRLCMNFQSFRDFLKNRNHPKAQWEIQAVAREIQRHLHHHAPNLFGETA